jgi:hypothetical protein
MAFPQGLGCVEYTLNVLLKGKKKFGSAKKWTSTLILKVEVSRRAIGARLEQMAIADSPLGKTKHNIMVCSLLMSLIVVGVSSNYTSWVYESLLHVALSAGIIASAYIRCHISAKVIL